jgi:hypothetical protein
MPTRRRQPELFAIPGSANSRAVSLFSLAGFVGVFEVSAQVAVNFCVAVDAQAEAIFRHLVENPLPEFHDIFLQGFVAGWVVEYLPDDARISRTQHIIFRNTDQVSGSKSCH